jgi:hypothetical protein
MRRRAGNQPFRQSGGARANPAREGGGLVMIALSTSWIRCAAEMGATTAAGSGGNALAEAAIAQSAQGTATGTWLWGAGGALLSALWQMTKSAAAPVWPAAKAAL